MLPASSLSFYSAPGRNHECLRIHSCTATYLRPSSRIRIPGVPLLRPTVIILLIMTLGKMFNSDFGLFYQVPMNSGRLYEATTTIDAYVYRVLMDDHDVGRSLAAGFVQSILGFVLVLGANLTVRKIEPDSALF